MCCGWGVIGGRGLAVVLSIAVSSGFSLCYLSCEGATQGRQGALGHTSRHLHVVTGTVVEVGLTCM